MVMIRIERGGNGIRFSYNPDHIAKIKTIRG